MGLMLTVTQDLSKLDEALTRKLIPDRTIRKLIPDRTIKLVRGLSWQI